MESRSIIARRVGSDRAATLYQFIHNHYGSDYPADVKFDLESRFCFLIFEPDTCANLCFPHAPRIAVGCMLTCRFP